MRIWIRIWILDSDSDQKLLFFVLKFLPSLIKRLPSLSSVTWLRTSSTINLQDLVPDQLERCTDLRIRIRTKMSRIHNTAYNYLKMWSMYNRMKLPYLGLKTRLLFTDFFRIQFSYIAMQRIYKQIRTPTTGSVGYGTYRYIFHISITWLILLLLQWKKLIPWVSFGRKLCSFFLQWDFWEFLFSFFNTVLSTAPQFPLCRRMLGSNLGLLRLRIGSQTL